MRKAGVYVLITSVLILLLVTSSTSLSLLVSTVILPSSGTISGSIGQPTYSISQTGTVFNVISKPNGTVVYSNTNAVTALEQAAKIANGTSLYVNITATCATNIRLQYLVNEKITFDPNSLLTLTNWVNVTLFQIWDCVNVNIIGINIDGNGAYQRGYSSVGGLSMGDCANCLVTQANITNCENSGILIGNNYAKTRQGNGVPATNNGITNSTITFAGWNGISIGWGGSDTKDCYAINNTVAYCSDVGITSYGIRTIITNNYIHNMNGTTGDQNSRYGIAIEGDGYATDNIIANNTIEDCAGDAWCGVGIVVGTGAGTTSNFVIHNNIINCQSGIQVDSDGSVVTRNAISYNGAGHPSGDGGILLTSVTNVIVSSNTITSSSTNPSLGPIIWIQDSANCIIANNTGTVGSTISNGLYFFTSNNNVAQNNNIQAGTGVRISASSYNNKIDQNTLTNCTNRIIDSGSGTIVDPTSSAAYTLTFCNPYDGTSRGTYIYSNSTQISISLTPGGVLNIDGSDVTLTNNAYTLNMRQDHYAYALGGTATISTI